MTGKLAFVYRLVSSHYLNPWYVDVNEQTLKTLNQTAKSFNDNLSIGPLETNYCESLIKMRLKVFL